MAMNRLVIQLVFTKRDGNAADHYSTPSVNSKQWLVAQQK